MSARIRLHDEAGPAVLVEKVATRNGHRMAITSVPTGRTAQLDPLELECLTWQVPETLRRWAATISTVHGRGGPVPDDDGGDTLELANEFATVLLRKVLVGRNEHLDVFAPSSALIPGWTSPCCRAWRPRPQRRSRSCWPVHSVPAQAEPAAAAPDGWARDLRLAGTGPEVSSTSECARDASGFAATPT